MVVKKRINIVQQLKGIIVGVLENMVYNEAPDGERYEIFGPSNGPKLVEMTRAPLLAQLTIDYREPKQLATALVSSTHLFTPPLTEQWWQQSPQPQHSVSGSLDWRHARDLCNSTHSSQTYTKKML
jgi:hypothetical protein